MNLKKRIWTGVGSLALICSLAGTAAFAQQTAAVKYSDPVAPVGKRSITVPKSVKPIMDTWLRDTYITLGPDNMYYMTGSTANDDRKYPNGTPHCWDYNDGIHLWRSKDLKKWEPMGLVWSFAKDAAPWQQKGKPVKAGSKSVNGDPLDSVFRALWAPEIHYVKSAKKWVMVACINGGQGSFMLVSTSGKPEGPYVNIAGNATKPLHTGIDLNLFEDTDGSVYLAAHNHYIAKMKSDLSDLAEPWREFKETAYNPEPYIEGVFLTKYGNKYQLLQTVWSVPKADGSYTFLEDPVEKRKVYSYDVVVAEADNIYGPYGARYPAIMEGGHNNLFKDAAGNWWSTTFFNPRGGRGLQYAVNCRPAVVPVKWVNGKLMPDEKRANAFYKD